MGFGFYCCVGGGLIPQGCSPWNLGYFLLVQKVTKDTPRERGISISPFPLDSFPLEPTKTRAAALFFDLFPGMQWGKVSAKKQSKKIAPRSDRMRPKGPQSAEIDTMPIEKSQPTLRPNIAQETQRAEPNTMPRPSRKPIQSIPQRPSKKITPRPDRMRPKGPQSTVLDTKKTISEKRYTVPPAERQRRKRGKACERCSNFKHDL